MRKFLFLVTTMLAAATAPVLGAECNTLHQLASVPMEIEKDGNGGALGHLYIAYDERKLYITAAEYKRPAAPAP